MDIHNFFKFYSKLASSTIMASPIGLDILPHHSGLFDHHRLILGDYSGIPFPLTFKQVSGKKWKDILHTGYVSLYLISDNMKMTLEEYNITGWKVFPIKLLDKKEHEIFGYHGFSITGRCGPIDYTKGEMIQKRILEHGPLRNYFKGLYVGLDTWDGSDFFLPENNFGIIITEKTAELLKKNKITDTFLVNLSNIEIPEDDVKIKKKI